MKKLLLLLLIITTHAYSNELITFKISKPLCVLTFLQTAGSNSRHNSVTLREYIYKHVGKDDSLTLVRLVHDFEAINLDYNYNIPGYPDQRMKAKNVIDLILMAAVRANDIDELMQRIIGLLPNEDWMKLKMVLNEAAPLYQKMLGTPYEKEMKAQLAALQQFSTKADDIFYQLKRFYGSTWSREMPFTVGIYCIPGKGGNTTATPHSNSLVLGVLTAEKDHAMRVCVAIHEMCHVLFAEQPVATQQQIDRWFRGNTSMSSRYAYSYLDEALATAAGNAWAYTVLAGQEDTTEWYNDEYINGYAHAIYPLVKGYIERGKEIDSVFVVQAIQAFETKFPDAYKSYPILMNSVNIYTDAKDLQEFTMINNKVNNYFRITNSYGSYPIADPQTQTLIEESASSQFFLVHTAHKETYKLLKAKFPQLKDMSAEKEGVISFFDNDKRPIIIINISDLSRLDRGLMRMVKAKEIKTMQVFLGLE